MKLDQEPPRVKEAPGQSDLCGALERAAAPLLPLQASQWPRKTHPLSRSLWLQKVRFLAVFLAFSCFLGVFWAFSWRRGVAAGGSIACCASTHDTHRWEPSGTPFDQ